MKRSGGGRAGALREPPHLWKEASGRLSGRIVEGRRRSAYLCGKTAVLHIDYLLHRSYLISLAGGLRVSGRAVGARQLRARTLELSDRDWKLLQSLRDHRFLTTSQLARWHFAGHRSPSAGIRACVRVLTRLRGLRLVARLDRTVGGLHAGSQAFVWTLDVAGDRLLRQRLGEPTPRQGRRFGDPSRTFLAHTLAIGESRVRLEEAARSGRFELVQVKTEPACWREYLGPHGSPAILKPDLAFETASGDFEDHWFLEVDRGTESIRTVLAKCAQYEAYRRTGREQAEHGVFPLVVWTVPDQGRRDRLDQELRRARGLDPQLFRIVAPDGLVALVVGDSPPQDSFVTHQSPPPTERRTP